MDLTEFQTTLAELDPLERLGKCHRETFGKNINYLQYLFLRNCPTAQNPEDLYTPRAVAEQQRIQSEFQAQNLSHILKPQNFFTEGKNLEIEKLLRYVDIPPHQHDFIECVYVFSGSCAHRINGQDYTQETGSFVTIPHGFTHSLSAGEDCLCLTLKLRSETFLKMQLPSLMNYIYPLAFSCGDDHFVRHSISSIWEQQRQRLPYCDQIEEQLFQTMMFYIAQRFHDNVQYLISGSIQDVRLVEILNYMLDNYRTVTLKSVADHFHYNPAYLSRLFHAQTGQAFSTLLKEFKLRQAARLLRETDRKLNDICDEIGYKDTTQLIRSFKSLYGVTPIKYRKQGAAHYENTHENL